MSPDQEHRLEELFSAVRTLPRLEQAAFLERACRGDAELRREADSLLAAHEQAGPFLQPTIALSAASAPFEKPGDHIGRYKLLEQIGEGGFGDVWMAEQEEPVRRRVALKIIKLGMDTREVVTRFEAERQALAMMDHANIARVFDAGATDMGRPFFVMELVRGIPITEYCDANKLSTRERLGLFIQVCQAVQHAHQKGVIHRDLKPTNILVTVQDDKLVPKVIDFGVAKATQDPLTESTVFTRFRQWIGTPAYMSPEQAGLGSLDVDTRSDVYSLGVLLYELLTGRPLFDTQKLLGAGYEAVIRTIREEDPPRPSTRLSTLTEIELGAVAATHSAEPAKLGRLMRGDLDSIVMKALEKDRTRRYETAAALASDLERCLKHEPVSATAPSIGYRLGKLVRRHRPTFVIATSLLAILVVAAGVCLWGLVQARENLWTAYLAQARASRRTHAAGHRFDTLEAVRHAAAIHPSIELRNEAASALALPDVRVAREWAGGPASTSPLAMDARGERYARSTADGSISVRRIADDRELWAFPGRGGSIEWVLRFSPDGRFLAATDYHPQERHLRVWNLETGKMVLDTPLAVLAASLAFQPHSAVIAAGDGAGSVHWFDLETTRHWVWEEKVRNPYAFCFRADGRRLAVSSPDRPGVGIYDTATGRLLAKLDHPDGVHTVDWSSDGHWLAAPCGDKNVYVWDVSGEPRLNCILQGHEDEVTWAAFHPSGDLLVSGSWDGTLGLWSAGTGHQWCRSAGSAHQAGLSADGRWLGLFGSGTNVRLLELEPAGGFQWLPTAPTRPYGAGDFSPNGRWMATGSDEGFTIWDTVTFQPVLQRAIGRVTWLGFCPTSSSLFTVSDTALSEWPLSIGQSGDAQLGPAHQLPVAPPFQMCNCSDDGAVVAVARSGVWVDDRRRSSTFCLAEWPICNEVALSPDGRWVAGRKWGSAEIHIWELPSQKEVKIFTLYYPHFRFSPDGRWFISGTETDLCSWEVGTWRQAYSCPHDGYGSQGRLAISRDGRWAALEESGGAAKLLNLPTLSQVVMLESVPGFPVSLSPDGAWLLVQSGKGNLGLWNLRRINQELTGMRLGWEDKTAGIPEASRASLGSVPALAPMEREAMTNASRRLH